MLAACRRGWRTCRASIALAAFALEVGAHSLTWFADYYGIPYADKKVDHIALPDFAQGAMENLGCITYREAALFVIPPRRRTANSSTSPRPSRTSSRTCGSATWSRCDGGTACG